MSDSTDDMEREYLMPWLEQNDFDDSDEYCFDFIKLELGRLNTLNKKRTSEYGFEKDNAVQLKVGGGKRSIGIVQRIRKNGDANIVWDDGTSSYETPDRLIRYDKSEVKEIPHTGWDGIK